MESSKIQSILEELGYKLYDQGNYWQCAALYRNGDNKTALQIYKDSGTWKDYVRSTPFMPFKLLLSLTLKTDDENILSRYISQDESFFLLKDGRPEEQKLDMEKIYPSSCIKELLPHYKFYNQKGIDSEILKKLKSGYATKGKMYQRFVFPIYNQYHQIHGFSGRDMATDKDRPKWKHIGRKTQWVYPAHVPFDSSDLGETYSSDYVIIVESIGDCLNLMQNGFTNVLVCFGLDISSKLLCYLVEKNFDYIFISLNNDTIKHDNAGKQSAVKNYLKLLNYFDREKIKICLPIKNDFGDMDINDFNIWRSKFNDLKTINQIPKIQDYANELKSKRLLSKPLLKQLKILNES